MINRNLALAAVAFFVLAGCTKKEEPTAAVEPTPSAAVAPVAPTSSMDEDDPSIVTAEDLADKANQEISAANLEEQLDALEKEIGSAE